MRNLCVSKRPFASEIPLLASAPIGMTTLEQTHSCEMTADYTTLKWIVDAVSAGPVVPDLVNGIAVSV